MRKPEKEPLDIELLRRLIDEEPCTLPSVLIGLAWLEGLSRHEIWELRWDDVDFEAAVLRVQGRVVPMEPEAADLLKRWKAAVGANDSARYVVVSPDKGTRPAESALSPMVRKALDSKKLNDLTLLTLRKDFVCRALESNDLPTAMRMTGISASTYRHIYKKEGVGGAKARSAHTERDAERLWAALERNKGGSDGIALWLTQMLGLTERETVRLTWEQYDEKKGMLHLDRGSLSLTMELISILNSERSKRTDEDDPHIVLSKRKRMPMSVSQLSEMLRHILIREGLADRAVSDFRRESRAEAQRSYIKSAVERQKRITKAEAERLLGVNGSVASARLTEMVESGDLLKAGRAYVPAVEGIERKNWEEAILSFLEKKGEVRIAEVAYLLHISKSTARRFLLRMVGEGKLVYERHRRAICLPNEDDEGGKHENKREESRVPEKQDD